MTNLDSELRSFRIRYKGKEYRSEAEWRWALVFEILSQYLGPFEYEALKFVLQSGYYLPDFWFPKLAHWIEIKRNNATELSRQLMQELTVETQYDGIIIDGCPHYRVRSYSYFPSALPREGWFLEFLCLWAPREEVCAAIRTAQHTPMPANAHQPHARTGVLIRNRRRSGSIGQQLELFAAGADSVTRARK